MSGPLTGLKVLDLSRVMAGPWCSQIFADMGAEVIKVERPKIGDETRQWGPPWLKDAQGNESTQSAYFLSCNRGKQSITIDISSTEGQSLIHEMAKKCDIVLENFKTGGLVSKNLDYLSLCKINPQLIYCSITGFGQTGPKANDPGYDYMIQGQGGLMSITGNPEGEPQRVGLAISDLTTGMNATIAILAALYHREKTGEGQQIDISLLDVQVSWLANQGLNYFCSNKIPQRTGDYHPNLVPYQPFKTSDGKVIIAVGNDRQFTHLCNAIGCAELATDAKFQTNPQRNINRVELIEKLSTRLERLSSEKLLELMLSVGVPAGKIQTIDQVFEDPQVNSRNMKLELNHPQLGKVPGIANPVKYSKTHIEYNKAPPTLGEDTETVLKNFLNKSDSEIEQLKNSGVV